MINSAAFDGSSEANHSAACFTRDLSGHHTMVSKSTTGLPVVSPSLPAASPMVSQEDEAFAALYAANLEERGELSAAGVEMELWGRKGANCAPHGVLWGGVILHQTAMTKREHAHERREHDRVDSTRSIQKFESQNLLRRRLTTFCCASVAPCSHHSWISPRFGPLSQV